MPIRRFIKPNGRDEIVVNLIRISALILLIASGAVRAEIASLKLESSYAPSDNYRCGLQDLGSKNVLHGRWNEKSGCRVQVSAESFSRQYSACWLGGVTNRTTQASGVGTTQCRVETFRGLWKFSAHSETGAIECTFLCLGK